MTARQCFEALLVELSKTGAPSMLLQDYNYYFNKAISLYINKRYNIYDVNQQTTDDLRVLKSTAILTPVKCDDYGQIQADELKKLSTGAANLFGGTYEINLPPDYLHMLNCVCIYKLNKRNQCYNEGDYAQFPAKRLTSDAWSTIMLDFFNRPTPYRPYYYIHNVNISETLPTNPVRTVTKVIGTDNEENNITIKYQSGTDMNGAYFVHPSNTAGKPAGDPDKVTNEQNHGTNFDRVISIDKINTLDNSVVERSAALRFGNVSTVRCEIRYGKDDTVYKLEKVFVDYIKAPQVIRLTQEQVDLTEDTSQIMEFPDYVCQEIINELVHLVLEATGDPRLQTNMAVTLSIANPVQQLAPQSASRQLA